MNLPTDRQINILDVGSHFYLAEFRSKVTTARPNSASLRATIPEAVVKLLELESGDEIIWLVKAAGGHVVVAIAKSA